MKIIGFGCLFFGCLFFLAALIYINLPSKADLASSRMKPIFAVLNSVPAGGSMSEEVARKVGLTVEPGATKVLMRQKGLGNGRITKLAMIPADGRDHIIFVVAEAQELVIYVSNSSGVLHRAERLARTIFESITIEDAKEGFANEIVFWETKLGIVKAPLNLLDQTTPRLTWNKLRGTD
jgi:hypothetical protein